MAANAMLSYHKLKQETWFDDDDDDYDLREKVIGRLRSSRYKRFHIKKRLKVRIPSLKGLVRRKARLLMLAWRKVCRRLRESQSHFGDLFSGNYLFMQVNPTPLRYGKSSIKGHDVGGFHNSVHSHRVV